MQKKRRGLLTTETAFARSSSPCWLLLLLLHLFFSPSNNILAEIAKLLATILWEKMERDWDNVLYAYQYYLLKLLNQRKQCLKNGTFRHWIPTCQILSSLVMLMSRKCLL